MAPRTFPSHVHPRLSFRLVFQILLLLFLLIWLLQSRLVGQSAAPSSPIVPRTAAELRALDALNQPPEVIVSRKKGEHHIKIPEKYDVTKIGSRHVDSGMNFYSLDSEIAMGKQMAEDIESHAVILHDPLITNYVTKLGQRLASNSDVRTPLVVKVIDSEEVNACALPGGFFYVNTGLIMAAQNEAELAAVMAHEIAHVAARHATRNMTKMQIWNIASIPMVFFGGPAGLAIREVSSIARPMSIMKFSRDAEREADMLGIEYQYAAGYDPVAFVNFFERLGAEHKNKNGKKSGQGKAHWVSEAFATHPMNEDRIHRAEKEIDTMLPPHQDYVLDTSEFQEAQDHLRLAIEGRLAFGHHDRSDGLVLRRKLPDPPHPAGPGSGPAEDKPFPSPKEH